MFWHVFGALMLVLIFSTTLTAVHIANELKEMLYTFLAEQLEVKKPTD